jgi:hypothetical protein
MVASIVAKSRAFRGSGAGNQAFGIIAASPGPFFRDSIIGHELKFEGGTQDSKF